MACSGRYASAAEYDALFCPGSLDLTDPVVLASVESALDRAASDVHMALGAVGACNCTLASWSIDYLKKLNIIDAAVIQNCPCGEVDLSDEQKQNWLEWINGQLELIRTGKIEVCEGATGSEYLAWGTVEYGWTEWNDAQLIINTQRKVP